MNGCNNTFIEHNNVLEKPLKIPLITLSSDFGPGNIGCGAMEAVVYEIAPQARVVHLCHSIRGFDVKEGARMLEGVAKLPQGFHVCVVDPGVGTERKGIAIQTKRGDVLIGPDNGLLRPAAEFLGGIVQTVELTNPEYYHHPVSPIFHGRDIFAPVAAHLANAVPLENFGPTLESKILIPSPYPEAVWAGAKTNCKVIHINERGSLFLNIRSDELSQKLNFGNGVEIYFGMKQLDVAYQPSFGMVDVGDPLLLPDDFGRVELAINQGNFAFTFGVKRGDVMTLRRKEERLL